MEQSEIIEGNELIAEFINLKRQPTPAGSRYYYNYNYSVKLFFYDNWDWLMPVVEKIESLGYSTAINYKFGIDLPYQIVISQGDYFEFIQQAREKITAVYKGVIEFIKWYNIQKK